MNIIMDSTSLIPHLFLSTPTRAPQRAPASIAAMKHRGIRMTEGRPPRSMPTQAAAMEPRTNWPSAPILKIPVRKEKATDRPVII